MADHPRIDELRRRVDKDPASIAFAQLAEEYRRAGENDEAIRVCRAGLSRHPGYLSARVTLGRALLETGQFDDAQNELEQVVHVAPDNLAAIRALADIHQRREEGGLPPAPGSPPEAPPGAAFPPDQVVAFGGSDDPFADALKTLDSDTDFATAPTTSESSDAIAWDGGDAPGMDESVPEAVVAPPTLDPVIAELEGWLAAILADRTARKGF